MEISFCKLRNKDVVNLCDGKNLGNITDIIFDSHSGKICGIIVPNSTSIFKIFKDSNSIFIPYENICKIGKDIILVDIIIHSQGTHNTINNQDKKTNNTQNN